MLLLFYLSFLTGGMQSRTSFNREEKSFVEVYDFITQLMKTDVESLNTTEKAKDEKPVENELVRQGRAVLIFRFNELMLELPALADTAVQKITESIAKKNMVDYTIASAFIFAATADTLSEFILLERNILEMFTELEAILINGYLWAYAIGFAGPFAIGLENPVQDCGSKDVLRLLADFEMEPSSISNMTNTQIFLFTNRFRSAAETRLFCIVSKTDRFVEAAVVSSVVDEHIDIVQLLQSFGTSPPSTPGTIPEDKLADLRIDLDDLDQELRKVWDGLEAQVLESYNFAYASRVSQNIIKVAIGIPNILGMVFGILGVLETMDAEELPAFADVPGVIVGAGTDVLTEGRATNEFFIAEFLNILGHQGWGYGYYAPYFLAIIDPDPGCGINQFHDVIRSYREFSNFTETFGTADEIASGRRILTLDVVPKFVAYRLKRFTRELKLALHCLLSRREETANQLLLNIEYWLTTALYRIEITSSIYTQIGKNI